MNVKYEQLVNFNTRLLTDAKVKLVFGVTAKF